MWDSVEDRVSNLGLSIGLDLILGLGTKNGVISTLFPVPVDGK